jgi:phage terminase large subunit
MNEINHKIPNKIIPLYETNKRYKVLYGGRGSGKSIGIADYLLVKGYEKTERILCTREYQNSIAQSVHTLLRDRIKVLNLQTVYNVTEKMILNRENGTEFYFRGLWNNEDNIKSIQGVTKCWVEESQAISRRSLDVLIPTIREENSEIIFSLNPTNEDDPVYTDFVISDRDDTLKIKMNHNNNKFFPDVLRAEMERDLRIDYDKYLHIWDGQCVKHSQAQVFYGKWNVQEFEHNDEFLYFGADWGFSNDPTALIRCFIRDNNLYIDYEAWGIGVDIDKTPDMFKSVPLSDKYPITADSARPETISYMQQHGFHKMKRSIKGKGSVEDGIAHLRGYEKIIIHPRCKHTIDEFRHYCYKTDNKTGQISSVLEDQFNHVIDALRYSCEDLMKNRQLKATMSLGR